MNGPINVPPAVAQQRAAEANIALMLHQFRMGAAKDLQKMFLARSIEMTSRDVEPWQLSVESNQKRAREIGNLAVSHADALMEALGPIMGVKLNLAAQKPQVEQ